MLNLHQLQQIDQSTPWLEITVAELAAAQPHPQQYSNPTGLHQATLNQLCLTKFQIWLAAAEIEATPSWAPTEWAAIWEVVTGGALQLPKSSGQGDTRIILIPTTTLDRDELIIPQEWVDLPNLLGDYYVAVQIDLEVMVMNFWGFTSHRLLKQRGEYTAFDRTYRLPSDLLITDLDILGMGQALDLQEISPVAELPSLSLDRALALIQELSTSSPYSPRTQLDWTTWGSMMNSPNLRSQLYQTRLQTAAIAHSPAPGFSLSDWLRGEFTTAISRGWHHDYQQAIVLNQQDTIERSKLINLQVDLQQHSVALLIGVIPQADEQTRILVQVFPTAGTRSLPPQLQLSYVDSHGAILRTVTARSNDNYIQLPLFSSPVGTEFSIQLQLYSAIVIERFQV
jgi:Protein of unknown function (DUF1822)